MQPLDFKYIYHSHTKRCGHAFGEDEEFVQDAIKQGVKILCFTDHTPFPFLSQKGTRMEFSQLDEYVASIKHLKEKYKDQIEIHIGLECENFPTNNQFLHEHLTKRGVEFLIIGQHCIMIDNNVTWVANRDYPKAQRLAVYKESIINALEEGLTRYIAHPDLIVAALGEYDKEVENTLKEIVKATIKYNAYIEFNVHGVRNCNLSEFGYPNKYFWNMVKKEYPNAKIAVGMDVHSLEEYENNIWLPKALEMINEIGISITPKIDVEKELKI